MTVAGVHPFFVITATVGSYSDRKWWIVCVCLDEEMVDRTLKMLKREASRFERRHKKLSDAHVAVVNKLNDQLPQQQQPLVTGATYGGATYSTGSTFFPSPTMQKPEPTGIKFGRDEYNAAYDAARAKLQAELDKLKLTMTDKKFPYSLSTLETPEYEIVPTFDDPSAGDLQNPWSD